MSVYETRALLVNERGGSLVSTSGITTQIINFPSPAPLSDTFANPTTTVVGSMNKVFGSSSLWERVRSVIAASGTVGIGIPAAGILGYNPISNTYHSLQVEDASAPNLRVVLYGGTGKVTIINIPADNESTATANLLSTASRNYILNAAGSWDRIRSVLAASGTTGIGLFGVSNLVYDGSLFLPQVSTSYASGSNQLSIQKGIPAIGIVAWDQSGQTFHGLRVENAGSPNLRVSLYSGADQIKTSNAASGTTGVGLLGAGITGYHPSTLKWFPFIVDNEQHLKVSQKSTSFTLIASGDGAVATASLAGTGGVLVYVTSISVSYAAAGVGRFTLKDGQTYVINQGVHNQRDLTFSTPLGINSGNTLEVQLTAVASVVGMIFVSGYITS